MNEQKNVLVVTDQNFASLVLQSTLPVIVEVGAEWCPPCRALMPVYEHLSHIYAGKLRFASMDMDKNPIIPAQFAVQGLPTMLVFQDGALIGRIVGYYPSRLQQNIDQILQEYVQTANASLNMGY